MKLSELTGTETGQHAHLTVDGQTYSGTIKHLRSNEPRTPHSDQLPIEIQIGETTFNALSPNTDIEVLDRLPAQLPAHGSHFPTETLERVASSKIIEHASGQESRVKLADGRTGTYYLDPAPNGGDTWILRRR